MWTSYSPGYRLSSDRMNHAPDTRFAYWGFRVIAESAAPFPAKPLVFPSKPLPAPVTNSLGMRFVPVPGTDILMCVHETRRRDYAPYHAAIPGADQSWKSTDIYGTPFKEDENLPVMRVSWEDAMLYCDWLSHKEGRLYRLPTDREWSRAVGIGTDEAPYMTPGELSAKITGVYPWGAQWPPPAGAGNYAADAAKAQALMENPKLDLKGIVEGYKDGFATLAPVMSLKPNALGLYDLGGNVQEWCLDWFDEKAGRRVMRGAAWNKHLDTHLISSRRDHTAYDGRGFNIGFRLVLVPGAKPPVPEPLKTPPQTAFTNTLGMKFVPVPGTNICICVHETRRGDYARYVAETPGADMAWNFTIAAGRPENQGDDFALGGMSWNDATAFCAWLSKKEGRTYRLPTDREWSCAVGIGQDEPPGFSASVLKNRLPGIYPWGKDWPPKSPAENFADTTSKAKFPPGNSIGLTAFIENYTDGFPTTARVMSFPPNALGIYDLGGNVREWCADHGNSATNGYVMRGGCWKTSVNADALSAFRMIREPDKRSSEYGFRLVAEPLERTR
jgi:formylglycine-generating enzyme required for sulfatase activity